jgi:coenzyme Q-binding protein COQ10
MASFKTKRLVHHKPEEMFDLVADVESYPEFLPLCESLVVRSRHREDDVEIIVATMTVAYKMVRESFTSRVTLDRAKKTIRSDYLNGPFHHLTSLWTFADEPSERTMVSFSIDYELRSWMLKALLGAVFDTAFRHFVEAFENRADAVYGVRGPATLRAVGSARVPRA